MRGWKLFKPEAAFAVRCPTCNAGPLQLCEGTDGRRPHRQRRIALFDERRGKPLRKLEPPNTLDFLFQVRDEKP